MGKKVKVVVDDPILTKNFKYEKRNKARLLDKANSQQQRAAELKRKKELMQIESKVDQQIQSMVHLTQLHNHNNIDKLKNRIFTKGSHTSSKPNKSHAQMLQIAFNNHPKIQNYHHYHFNLIPTVEMLLREKKTTLTQKIEMQTREEIKNMFGTKNIEEEQVDKEEQSLQGEVYNISPAFKVQSQVKIQQQLYTVSKLFTHNSSILHPNPLQTEDIPLDNAQMLIKSYFDHIFIENHQEEKIEQFRKIVISHSMEHIQRCAQEQKGRGFTNCKVLILTPFFGDAKAIIDIIEEQFPTYQVVNREKLQEVDDQNDFFRVGIKIARKKQLLTYFSSFDHSQFIIASPVGLKSIIGSEGDAKRQNSFISSVEILYIDRASTLLMQNWGHLTQVLKNLNFMPKYQSLKNSIDSIRDSFLELKGRLYRQNIVFSQFNFPQLNALKLSYFHNLQGLATNKIYYPKPTFKSNVQHNFYKIEIKQPKEDLQTRFDYFKRKFWDDIHNKESMTKIILFTNSYFEYVKLKSFLEKVNASAQYICEHTSTNKVQSRLAKFNNDQFRILLITERAYYFDICQVKKFHHIYFYSLPKNSFIFEEIISNIQLSENQRNSVVSIYTKFDSLILERIVGTSKGTEMVREYCNNVSFII